LDNLQGVMEWSTLILASNPTVKKKMYEELQQHISMHKMVTMEMKNHLPYTGTCIFRNQLQDQSYIYVTFTVYISTGLDLTLGKEK
jgi:hypothetical protein